MALTLGGTGAPCYNQLFRISTLTVLAYRVAFKCCDFENLQTGSLSNCFII